MRDFCREIEEYGLHAVAFSVVVTAVWGIISKVFISNTLGNILLSASFVNVLIILGLVQLFSMVDSYNEEKQYIEEHPEWYKDGGH